MIPFDNSGKFFVQSHSDQNAEFVNRQKNVFEKLDAVAKDKEKSVKKQIKSQCHVESVQSKSRKRHRNDTRQFRGQESIFKLPEASPPPRLKRDIPDYRRHPQKWTRYTLSDVSQEDMSDQSNTAAAMSFLQELKAKKESEGLDVDSEVKQITFKKPTKEKAINEHNECEEGTTCKYESPSFRSSKFIMPEYVVGEKKISKRNTPKLPNKPAKTKEIKLGHLNEEDDEF